jgi:hypothetical protein
MQRLRTFVKVRVATGAHSFGRNSDREGGRVLVGALQSEREEETRD